MSRVELITGPERRRRWPEAERLRILEAALAPGAVVADVARQYDVCTSLIYKWRREARGERPAAFMPVTLKEEPAGGGVPCGPKPALLVVFAGGVRVMVSLSTLADQVGACAVALQPLFERLQAHVLAAERLHGDDTTVPVLATYDPHHPRSRDQQRDQFG